MAWFYLIIAGLFEIVWAVGLKYSEGFTRLYPSIGTVIAMVISFYFLAQGLKVIPVGTAYAVWTGIGAVGTAILGMILFDESRDLLRISCILLIIAGIIGLKLVSPD
ncbi:quaternary ammonium compound efflux SMR transporter SugE [Halalkalibaculum sp. DA3122]|uniref:quaternary ammonium compound efflux SMR transporter SugE n=1 Tax=unclassified Halalkalibaculum TaxID=2964617 RepID=UPI0037553944